MLGERGVDVLAWDAFGFLCRQVIRLQRIADQQLVNAQPDYYVNHRGCQQRLGDAHTGQHYKPGSKCPHCCPKGIDTVYARRHRLCLRPASGRGSFVGKRLSANGSRWGSS